MAEPLEETGRVSAIVPHHVDLGLKMNLQGHQLEVLPELEADVVAAAIMQAAIDASPAASVYLDGWRAASDIRFRDLDELRMSSQRPDDSVIAQINMAFGRQMNISLKQDGTNVIGLYDATSNMPLATDLAGKIWQDAGDRYELLQGEKEALGAMSKEPLEKQLTLLIERIPKVFSFIPPEIRKPPKNVQDNVHIVPDLGDFVEQLRTPRAWVKVENPKSPYSIRADLENGDTIIATIMDDGEYASLRWDHSPSHDIQEWPSDERISHLDVSFNPPTTTSYLQIETYNGWELMYEAKPTQFGETSPTD